jgi:D-glycero-alpha-D-manno-heptose-7-phosphate kinase
MIITSTPLRISFFGGGTDYPVWYRQYGGAVLATFSNKGSHVAVYEPEEVYDRSFVNEREGAYA